MNAPARFRPASRALSLLAVVLVAAAPAFGDRVVLRGARAPIDGVTVVAEDFVEVAYLRPDATEPERVRARDVSDVVRAGSPAYDAGRERTASGDVAGAAKAFELALSKDGSAPWVKEYARFRLAECRLALGAADEKEAEAALRSLERLRSDFPKSRFLPEVELAIGRCLVRLSRFRDAERQLSNLEGVARGVFGVPCELRARLGLARSLESEGRFGEAQAKYASLADTAEAALAREDSGLADHERATVAAIAAEARNGVGACLVLAGKLEAAESHFRALVAAAEARRDEAALASALNGLGECLFRAERFDEAFHEFARTSALHFGVDEETSKALYWMGLCAEAARPGAPGLEASRTFYDQLAATYPATEWASRARRKSR